MPDGLDLHRAKYRKQAQRFEPDGRCVSRPDQGPDASRRPRPHDFAPPESSWGSTRRRPPSSARMASKTTARRERSIRVPVGPGQTAFTRDALRSEVDGRRAQQADDGVLGGYSQRPPWNAARPGSKRSPRWHRRRASQRRNGRLYAEEHAPRIHGEESVEGLQRIVDEGVTGLSRLSVEHGGVQAPNLRSASATRCALSSGRETSAVRQETRASPCAVLQGRTHRRRPGTKPRPCREQPCRGAAYPCRDTRDRDHFALQARHASVPGSPPPPARLAAVSLRRRCAT